MKTTKCKWCESKIHPEGKNGALLAYPREGKDANECFQCHEELYWLKKDAAIEFAN